jgi:hypothetical protein
MLALRPTRIDGGPAGRQLKMKDELCRRWATAGPFQTDPDDRVAGLLGVIHR